MTSFFFGGKKDKKEEKKKLRQKQIDQLKKLNPTIRLVNTTNDNLWQLNVRTQFGVLVVHITLPVDFPTKACIVKVMNPVVHPWCNPQGIVVGHPDIMYWSPHHSVGRIIREGDNVVAIVEHKDATEAQRAINEINTGMMMMNGADLKRWLGQLSNNNAQQEYYLTDIFRLMSNRGERIDYMCLSQEEQTQIIGVNTPEQLRDLERSAKLNLQS